MHDDFNWFVWLGLNEKYLHVYSGILISLILIAAASLYRLSLKTTDAEAIPDGRLSLKNLLQATVEAVLSLMEGVIGKEAKLYFPLIGTLFIYVLANNLLGAIPGFTPATGSISTNLACSLTVFVYYNYLGIKKQGLKEYLKHFMGPVIFIAPLLIVIELISHFVRPLTLAIRLYGNLTGDHIVLGIFSDLVPIGVPVIFMAFGVFVSFVQAFVFTLLSTVYIGLAVAHEEGQGHH